MQLTETYKGLFFDDLKEGDAFILAKNTSALEGKKEDYLFVKKCGDDGCNATYMNDATLDFGRFSIGTNPRVKKINKINVWLTEE